MKKTVLFFILFFTLVLELYPQKGYHFKNTSKNKERIRFQLINNLVVIPLEINGKKLSFILDSGVSKTILFNITKNDSIGLNDVEKVALQGLGKGEPVEALLSKNNTVTLKNITNTNETIYVVIKDKFDLSAKMGITIHGILGYSLLRNFIVKINYRNKKIDFFNPKTYQPKKCRKCATFPIQFYRKKPFIDAQVQLDTVGNELTNVKLLIDSGGSDALWFFEGTKKNIKTPKRFFRDVLGEGLSGAIYGNRSRIPKIKLKSFEVESPTASFLDSSSTINARTFKERNGSIGAEILKRFLVWFNYPNQQFTLKKKGSLRKGFNYNMSGLDIVYNGKQLVKEQDVSKITDAYNQKVRANNSISFITSFSYKFKPSYKIKGVLENSPAYKAGIRRDDIILKINNKPAHEYTLGDILGKLREKNGKRIKMLIERKGVKMKFTFRLEKKV
ncbi:aspartyl protease family protein [Polaribacter sp.]|uniref:aspartyl protease family protein n=1 Tax=Polaribacter sp. TaxID=1920175 RepID=UPI003F6B1158